MYLCIDTFYPENNGSLGWGGVAYIYICPKPQALNPIYIYICTNVVVVLGGAEVYGSGRG